MGVKYDWSHNRYKHRYVWEQHNGEIPSGYVIHHINGNARDNRIENLIMVTQQVHMRMHYPKKWKQINGNWYRLCSGCGLFLHESKYHISNKNGKTPGIANRCKKCVVINNKKLRHLKKMNNVKVFIIKWEDGKMAYCRFGKDSDVYLFLHGDGGGFFNCCGCRLTGGFSADTYTEIIAHLREHRKAGHKVRKGLIAYLLRECKKATALGKTPLEYADHGFEEITVIKNQQAITLSGDAQVKYLHKMMKEGE